MPVIQELNSLVQQLGPKCPEPCLQPHTETITYPPVTFPFAQVTMTVPPPCPAPTTPCPVKPLQLPCPPCKPRGMSEYERLESRFDNFYNNYNIDWHNISPLDRYEQTRCQDECSEGKKMGVAVDGKPPCCGCCKICKPPLDKGCPTGFKPCCMKMTPPCNCDPRGVWFAEVQLCPPNERAKKEKKKKGCSCG